MCSYWTYFSLDKYFLFSFFSFCKRKPFLGIMTKAFVPIMSSAVPACVIETSPFGAHAVINKISRCRSWMQLIKSRLFLFTARLHRRWCFVLLQRGIEQEGFVCLFGCCCCFVFPVGGS